VSFREALVDCAARKWNLAAMTRRFRLHIRSLVAAGALAGCFLGALTGLAVMRGEEQAEVGQLAANSIARADEVNGDTVRVLEAINTSILIPCSEEDLTQLRRLVITSLFLKSAGRVAGNRLLCSSTLGKLDPPADTAGPDFITDHGRRVLMNTEMFGIPGVRGMVVEHGSASVVLSPHAYAALADPRLDYIHVAEHLGTRTILATSMPGLQLPPEPMASNVAMLVDGKRFEVRCSTEHTGCVLARLRNSPSPAFSPIFMGFALLGLVAGAGVALGVNAALEHRQSLDQRLRTALRAGALSLAYQPIVRLADHSTVGAEALLRWTDEQGNAIPPDLFIAAAEEGGFIPDITRYVVRRTLSELAPELRAQPGFQVTVNLSAQDLLDETFPAFVAAALAFMRVAPASIGFEVTERSTANHASIGAGIRRLREAGHRVYIDDFGTGYSSLSYLRELHVDAIKIDRSFTNTIGKDSKGTAITAQIVAMAASLKLMLVIEGVETEEQAAYFRQLEPGSMAQGWLFGRPVPASSLFAPAS
jgi:sensor c-di-GMP phosphodiesterase-like protein